MMGRSRALLPSSMLRPPAPVGSSMIVLVACILACFTLVVEAFGVGSISPIGNIVQKGHTISFVKIGTYRRPNGASFLKAVDVPADLSTAKSSNEDEDDDDEWEYEEFETLDENDFFNSEWKVGTVLESSGETIDETWFRLITTEEGENLAIWGDGAKGKWSLDVNAQFFSISKETFGGWLGKKIWAGGVDDFYYLQGSVRGWSPLQPASVLGQWQAKRLGVDPDEAGVAP
eukprot:6477312-Ditylum_brightwellii.AAC.1